MPPSLKDHIRPPFCLNEDAVPALAQMRQASGVPAAVQKPGRPSGGIDAVEANLIQACVETLHWLQATNAGQALSSKAKDYPYPQNNSISKSQEELAKYAGTNDNYSASIAGRNLTSPSGIDRLLLDTSLNLSSVFTSNDFSNLPQADISFQAAVARILADSRALPSPANVPYSNKPEQNAPKIPLSSVGQRRWILSSLLRHYLGPVYGQRQLPLHYGGKMVYATDKRADQAIRDYFPRLDGDSEDDMVIDSATGFGDSSSHIEAFIKTELAPLGKEDNSSSNDLGAGVQSRKALHSSNSASHHRRPMSVSSGPYYRSESLDDIFPADLSPLSERYGYRKRGPITMPSSPSQCAGENSIEHSFDDLDSFESEVLGSPLENASGRKQSRADSISTSNSQTRLISPDDGSGPLRLERESRTLNLLRYSGACLAGRPLAAIDDCSENVENVPRPYSHQSRDMIGASTSSDWTKIDLASRQATGALPPTTNELSAMEKQKLVKKNRKLRAVLGAKLDGDDPKIFAKPIIPSHAQEGATEQAQIGLPGIEALSSNQHYVYESDEDAEPFSSGMSHASSIMPGLSNAGWHTDTFTSPEMTKLSESPNLGRVWMDERYKTAGERWSQASGADDNASPTSLRRKHFDSNIETKDSRQRKLMKV